MDFINSVVSWIMKKRIHQIELFIKYPVEVQNDLRKNLISFAKDTEWGRSFDFQSIHTLKDFQNRIPLQNYESLQPWIYRIMNGEKNILWPTEIRWFAKSSGTTCDKSKFIPVTSEALEECHFKGGKDLLSIYCNNFPDTNIFAGKLLSVGGSCQINSYSNDSYYGDLSAVLTQNLPFWVQFMRTPDISIALMDEWESKIEKMAEATRTQNVTNITGVPSWTLVLFKKILESSGKTNLLEIWPNLELIVHGGVNFTPYQNQFRKIIPSGNVNYLETYNASEGFFGIQDQSDSDEMLLMLDYGIFYEFIPVENMDENIPECIDLSQVKTGVSYALVITTNGGLWRYQIGDTIRFTSLDPYRIKISGRTKHFINAFGEELIIENAEKAMGVACSNTSAIIHEFTAAPIYFSDDAAGAHEWLIEFAKQPDNLKQFMIDLDDALKSVNSDYEAKRHNNMALQFPVIKVLPEGAFNEWLKSKNKLGGQNKVPRLANNRQYVDEILKMCESKNI